MPPPLKTVLAFVIVAWLVIAIVQTWLSRRLLVVDIEDGKVKRASGKVPQEVLSEVLDVLEHAKSTGHAEVRLSEGKAIVVTRGGIDDNVAQRLRNVIGRFPLAKLRSGRPIRRRG
ncbi:MAG: DUF3634 family protein [Polyangiaceae bacterium]|nr:DUF3634 family protein [Polyangiaceae bacterium]